MGRRKKYICPECGNKLVFEDSSEDFLVCENCGYDVATERYGLTDEEYEAMYPTYDDLYGGYEERDEDDCGEYYEEVFDELTRRIRDD